MDSIHGVVDLSHAKQTDSHSLLINNAYGFTYKPSDDNNNGDFKSNQNRTLEKYQQIKDIDDSGVPFPEYIHKISISAGNPQNFTAIKDYKAVQKNMQKIEKLIDGCDVNKDFITSSLDTMDLCMDYASFVYETCAGDHNIYAPICNNGVIEHILKTTKPSSEQLNKRAYDEARISVPSEYRNR
jgi:hypothetical protein